MPFRSLTFKKTFFGERLEQELIKKCIQKDSVAFESLINIYRTKLYSYLLRSCGDRMTAEDLFQETLIKVWKGFNSYNEQNKFSSWLFSIAHNVAVDSIKSRSVRNTQTAMDEIINYSDENNPHKKLVIQETRKMILSAVDSLTSKQKEVFLLRLHSGMRFKEIAKLTKQPLNTVLGHMHYAVSKIRGKVGKIYED